MLWSVWFSRDSDVGYSCLTDSLNLNNQGTVYLCSLLLPNCWLFDFLLVPPMLACWVLHAADMAAIATHHSANMGSHGVGVACALVLLVSLANGSAPFVLCCPCANCSGSEVWLAMNLSGLLWLHWRCWLPLPWLLMPGPNRRAFQRDLMNGHACCWSSGSLGPHQPFCIATSQDRHSRNLRGRT